MWPFGVAPNSESDVFYLVLYRAENYFSVKTNQKSENEINFVNVNPRNIARIANAVQVNICLLVSTSVY